MPRAQQRGPRKRKEKDEKAWQKKQKKKFCIFCKDKTRVDYKDVSILRKFVSDRGKIRALRVTARAGGEGRLSGSVSAADIAHELEARAGGPVDRRTVHLAEPIRSIGTHEVTIRLHPEVEVSVTVEVADQ